MYFLHIGIRDPMTGDSRAYEAQFDPADPNLSTKLQAIVPTQVIPLVTALVAAVATKAPPSL
jgi:hypothetical protein